MCKTLRSILRTKRVRERRRKKKRKKGRREGRQAGRQAGGQADIGLMVGCSMVSQSRWCQKRKEGL